VLSKKYAEELTKSIKAGGIQMNLKTKNSELVPFVLTNYDRNVVSFKLKFKNPRNISATTVLSPA
jgi:hypothetical protein